MIKMIKDFAIKYKHFWIVPIYFVFYITLFAYVENRSGLQVHILYSQLDKYIPFCEYFIIPYALWFLYIAAAVIYFGLFHKNLSDYYRLIINLGVGMTIFLIVSLVFPNGHNLRPFVFQRDNIFVDMVRYLYRIDTSTNILPSIHVFNSVAVAVAISGSEELKKHTWIVRSSNVLAILIICSTVFLKQHTIIDVVTALILNVVSCRITYRPGYVPSRKPVPEIR